MANGVMAVVVVVVCACHAVSDALRSVAAIAAARRCVRKRHVPIASVHGHEFPPHIHCCGAKRLSQGHPALLETHRSVNLLASLPDLTL